MTIVYPLTFPSQLTIEDFQIDINTAAAANTSPFSLSQQVYDFGGEIWQFTGSMPTMVRENSAIYSSFLMSLRGIVGTFLMPIPDSKNPLGSWGGTPVVNGAGQTGDTLAISGLPASQVGCAKAGDFIQLGTGNSTRLHRVVADADSDGSGNMTVTIVPRLRESPADGATVIYQNAHGRFRLDERTAGYAASPKKLYNMQISCREAL